MIDFNFIDIKRTIIHTINAGRTAGSRSATVTEENNIITLSDGVVATLRQRLIDSFGMSSKSFELVVSNDATNSFFDVAKSISEKNNPEFVTDSVKIAKLLANSQTKPRIPGGYLLVIDALYNVSATTSFPICVVIKAEPHDALSYNQRDSQLTKLENIFLSPTQKLYKIGVLYKKNQAPRSDIRENFGAILFDDQFRTDGTPAEYFYKDFLGYSIDSNAKIMTQKFYFAMNKFIVSNFVDPTNISTLIDALKAHTLATTSPLIDPASFRDTYICDSRMKSKFDEIITAHFNTAFTKDIELLKSHLSVRKIWFSNGIILKVPEREYSESIEIIKSSDAIDESFTDEKGEYTLIKIYGKPYSKQNNGRRNSED